jgi:hypothetical protein
MSLPQRLSVIQDACLGAKRSNSYASSPSKKRRKERLLSIPLDSNVSRTKCRVSRTISSDENQEEGGNGQEAPNQEQSNTLNGQELLADHIVRSFSKYETEQSNTLGDDLKALEEKRLETRDKQIKLYRSYLYGLKQISELTDLRNAPDAYLTGNFSLK